MQALPKLPFHSIMTLNYGGLTSSPSCVAICSVSCFMTCQIVLGIHFRPVESCCNINSALLMYLYRGSHNHLNTGLESVHWLLAKGKAACRPNWPTQLDFVKLCYIIMLPSTPTRLH